LRSAKTSFFRGSGKALNVVTLRRNIVLVSRIIRAKGLPGIRSAERRGFVRPRSKGTRRRKPPSDGYITVARGSQGIFRKRLDGIARRPQKDMSARSIIWRAFFWPERELLETQPRRQSFIAWLPLQGCRKLNTLWPSSIPTERGSQRI